MWMYNAGSRFGDAQKYFGSNLLVAPEVEVGEWQSIKQSGHPMMVTYELQNAVLGLDLPLGVGELQDQVHPNLPWAEDHFLERVSGDPLNPPPSEAYWPFAVQGNAEHKKDEKYSHTYPERFWPKFADNDWPTRPVIDLPHRGIRFTYGDLADVVEQLGKSPATRQAYLPVWFPEDTGAVHKERVPCTLGYQFLIREGQVNITYFIRSCDFVRHFPDDVYMAGRLAQWMSMQLRRSWRVQVQPGQLVMHMTSLHVFGGDLDRLRRIYD